MEPEEEEKPLFIEDVLRSPHYRPAFLRSVLAWSALGVLVVAWLGRHDPFAWWQVALGIFLGTAAAIRSFILERDRPRLSGKEFIQRDKGLRDLRDKASFDNSYAPDYLKALEHAIDYLKTGRAELRSRWFVAVVIDDTTHLIRDLESECRIVRKRLARAV